MMHSEEPARIVQWFIEETNNVIYRVCGLYPDRFRGMAGCRSRRRPARLPGQASCAAASH